MDRSYLESYRKEQANRKKYNAEKEESVLDLLSRISDWKNDEIKTRPKNGDLSLEKDKEITKISMGIDFLKSLNKVKEKTNQLKRVLVDLEDLQTDLDFHSEEIQAMANNWVQTQAELEEKKYECRHLLSTLKLQQKQADRRELEIENLIKEIKRYQTEFDIQREKLLQKESEINTLALQPQYKEERALFNYDNLISTENELEKAKKEMKSNQLELQKKMQGIEELQRELVQKQEETKEENQLTASNSEEITQIQKQINKIFEEIGEEDHIFDGLKSELVELKKQLVENPIQPLSNNETINLLQNELNSTNAELELRNEIIKKLRNGRPSVDNHYDEEYHNKYCKLKDEFDALNEDYRELKNAVEKLVEEKAP